MTTLSLCCSAPAQVIGNVTKYYRCADCGRACDTRTTIPIQGKPENRYHPEVGERVIVWMRGQRHIGHVEQIVCDAGNSPRFHVRHQHTSERLGAFFVGEVEAYDPALDPEDLTVAYRAYQGAGGRLPFATFEALFKSWNVPFMRTQEMKGLAAAVYHNALRFMEPRR